jgi:hypothetical protein
MWRESALRNPSIDFMFFTDAEVEPAKNIIVNKMQFEVFRNYIQNVFDFPIVLDRPYILCDFKPAYGESLQQYISKYDYWGYGDLDVVYGDIRTFLTDEVLANHKFFLGFGHLTLYHNDEETNSYYKVIKNGYQDYHESLSTREQTFFDEYDHKGTADKWRECRPLDSWTTFPFDNVSKPKQSYHFNSLTRGWEQVIFEHIDSKLYMIRFNKGELEKIESLYAHFQHRPFMKDKVNNYDHFLITPSSMIDYPSNFVKCRLKFYCRKRKLMTKYYQWKDRILWKIGKSHYR